MQWTATARLPVGRAHGVAVVAQAYVYEDDATGWRLIAGTDLPNSGAGAGSYGDSTHIPVVTVNAQGLITAASSVAVAGSGITAIASPGASVTVTNPAGPTTNLDLPNSGAAAGVYGDASDIPVVTVNARGVVTSITTVAASGAPGSSTKIFDSTLGVAAAAIDTNPTSLAGYDILEIFLLLRTTSGSASVNAQLTFNNDTGANYDVVDSSGSTQAAGTSILLTAHGSGGGANYAGASRLTIPGYAATTFFKAGEAVSGTVDSTVANDIVRAREFAYRSAAAITRVAITAAAATTFVAGSRMIVYGR